MCNKGKICPTLSFQARQVRSTGCWRQPEEYPFWKTFWISKGGLFFYLFPCPGPRPCISFQLWGKCGRKHFSRWRSQGRKAPDCTDKKAKWLDRTGPMAGAHKAWWWYTGQVDQQKSTDGHSRENRRPQRFLCGSYFIGELIQLPRPCSMP